MAKRELTGVDHDRGDVSDVDSRPVCRVGHHHQRIYGLAAVFFREDALGAMNAGVEVG